MLFVIYVILYFMYLYIMPKFSFDFVGKTIILFCVPLHQFFALPFFLYFWFCVTFVAVGQMVQKFWLCDVFEVTGEGMTTRPKTCGANTLVFKKEKNRK